jgi:hypothetical protein
MIKDIILKTCNKIQFKVHDEQNNLAGYIADELFFPCLSADLSSQGDQPVPLYPIRVNPFRLNRALLEYQDESFQRSKSNTEKRKKSNSELYKSVYINYLYELLTM